jgi:membrane associated rhomboid family serine protease
LREIIVGLTIIFLSLILHFGENMDWLTHIGSFLLGLGAGWTLKVVISNRSSRSKRVTVTSQRYNKAGGDIVGGDMHKDNRR